MEGNHATSRPKTGRHKTGQHRTGDDKTGQHRTGDRGATGTVRLPGHTRKLRQEVREFLAAERAAGTIMGRPDSWLTGWDPAFSRRLAERGWVGMALPREYGGSGRGNLERYVVIEELLAAGAPVSAHWVADRQAGPSILRHGTEEQRRRFLPGIAAGQCFFSIGMSEQDSGSDLASVRTRAERTGDGWRLTGTKMWTGGAHVNDFAIVLARTEDAEDPHAGLSQFIVDLRDPRIRVEPVRLLSGEHTFNRVHLDGVELAPDALLGRPGDGWRQVTGELALERSGPERFLSTLPLLVALVGELRQRACTADQHTRIGRLTTRLASIRQLSLGVAAALEAGRPADVQAALVKDLGTRFEGELVGEAREILPLAARFDATRGSYPELLAAAVLHSPGYTLRGGTNEILRGIITRGLETSPSDAEAPTSAPATAEYPRRRASSAMPPLAADPAAAVALADEAGYRGSPGPLAETLLVARPLLAAAGLAGPDGPLTFAAGPLDVRFAHVDGNSRVGPVGAAGTDGALRVSGTLVRVPWAGAADAVVVLTEGPSTGPVLLLLDPADGLRVEGANLAGEPRDDLLLVDVPVPAARVRRIPAALALQAQWRSGLARAALIAGAARRCVDLTVAHTSSRVQFGRPLSRFQAVKQEQARLIEEAALVTAAVEAAAAALADPDTARFPAQVAAAQASASVGEITRIAHQLHGAVGFTELSPLHLATTRLWSWRDEDGTEQEWFRRIGRRVVESGGDRLWPSVTGA